MRNRSGIDIPVPRVTGEIRRPAPVQVDDVRFLRAHTDRAVKITVPGPFTMAQQAQNDHYRDDRALALAYADVVREEIADLFAAGADIVQVDEPWLQARPDVARRYGAEAVTRAVDGAAGPVHVHLCFGYAAMVAERPAGYSFLPELADTPADTHLGGDGAVAPRPRDPAAAAGQGHRARRPRPLDPGGGDAGDGRRPRAPGAGLTSTSTG